MGTFGKWRRAFGAIKDSTTVGLAKVSSDFKNIDIAIVKATNHEECPPKDLHVKRIINATSFAVPRADVGYCIHTLSRRLMKTKNWIVAVKTLMVFHRILHEGDTSFREELLTYSRRQPILQIPEFRDESSQLACDCSSWIRMYASFVEERLECYRLLGFDIETERLTTTGTGKAYSKTRFMNINELLIQLPAMQQLLNRLIACQPEGAACHNGLIQHALVLVVKESLKIYNAINDGISKLVESFFDLPRDDALNALSIYKKAEKQVEKLEDFYNIGKHLRHAMDIQFPTLSQAPPSFLATMEEYVKSASCNGSISNKNPPKEHQDVIEGPPPQEIKEVDIKEVENKVIESKKVVEDQEHTSKPVQKLEKKVLPLISIDDEECLDLDETSMESIDLNSKVPRSPLAGWNEDEKTSSWELSVVPLPTNNATNISQTKSCGGLDRMFLYSLYEDDIAKKQKQNEFGMQHMSHHHHQPLTTMQTVMKQQQTEQQPYQQYQSQYQQWYQHQQNRLVAYNHQQSSNQYLRRQMSNTRPSMFGDGIKYPQGNHGLM